MSGILGFITGSINTLCQPHFLFVICIALFFALLFVWREWFAKKSTILWVMIGMTVFFVLSLFNATFQAIVTKPDNVPIVGMTFLVVYFFWLSVHKMVINDRLISAGKEVESKAEAKQTVFTWPDLVFSEFICTIVVWAGLLIWSIVLKAPLEEPANPVETPNPSKAPWYFLGLQEMLVYYDPWLAGVVFPSLIIVGLIVIPYIDTNPKGNGYFTFNERKLAITTFLFGFMILWVLLIMYGTFLRGPNWNFFGPYEVWDLHKLEVLTNVNLSEYIFRVFGLNGGRLPDNIFIREGLGMVLSLVYITVGPWLVGKYLFKDLLEKMGKPRFYVFAILLLSMGALPLKMVLRWVFNLKYIVAIPEYFFNI